ncbi:TPA: hypothetical protein ANIA_11397 [Aspergillus nidulans FGSC A4]|uniref:Uncharacterized protein n=1 Tax=Emericella nidulans (strain FGSC A4 / ATCC 38163 / CBS 112.46 / NRRL 194 / M139) TaxID=227321 RepID=C8VH94_EMENI|nr:TPA: hypothetical protein ANIA_11397 [Aspergillus nidulans FGSC A4]
MNYNYKNYL